MQTYRVGIIGFGFIGKVHAHGYVNMPFYYSPQPIKAKITHVCTSNINTAEAGRALIGADLAITDFRQITENPDIDIVHICTPNHLHKNALLSAMEHNKHIYCDKPLVASLSEADEIQEALHQYHGTAQMTFQNRFFPATIRAQQLIQEGFLGKILEFRCCYLHSGNAEPTAPLKWKLTAEAGGGVIADLASHVLDLMHFMVGDYESIVASTHTAYPERPSIENPKHMLPVNAEDSVMILARMRNGALGHIEATKIATGSEDELRFEIHGSHGALRFNTMNPHQLEAYDMSAQSAPIGGFRGWTAIDTGHRYPEPASGFPTPKASIGWLRSHIACLASFLQSVAEGKPGYPGLEQGIYVQKLMHACRESAKNGCWINIT